YEELAPALEVVQGVAGGDTGAVREHRTALTVREVTRPRHPTDVMGVQERSTPGGRDYEPPEADQPPRRGFEGQNGSPRVTGPEIGDPSSPGRKGLGDGPHMILGNIAHALLVGFQRTIWALPDDDLGPTDLEFVFVPAHGFDQNRELEFT